MQDDSAGCSNSHDEKQDEKVDSVKAVVGNLEVNIVRPLERTPCKL